jgi:hypothetical protein
MVDAPKRTLSDEILDVLLSRPSPEDILALRPSDAAQARLRELLDTNRHNALTDEQKAELTSFLELETFVRRLKIRAREKLAERP